MEKEEILLGVELEKLLIEPVKLHSNLKATNTNPFCRDVRNSSVSGQLKCTCYNKKISKHTGIAKKKPTKILKEPILNLLKSSANHMNSEETPDMKCDPLSLCTLVQNCNQLRISSDTPKKQLRTPDSTSKWWKNDLSGTQESKDSRQQASNTGTCSQQALNPPCDVTIDELASYFETLVHIPKKMSSMAEMMYI